MTEKGNLLRQSVIYDLDLGKLSTDFLVLILFIFSFDLPFWCEMEGVREGAQIHTEFLRL